MPGVGIGLGVGLGGGGAAWSEAEVARVIARGGLDDAGARAAIGGAASLPAGLRAVGLLPAASAPASTPSVTPLPAGLAARWDAASLAGLADGAAVTSWTDSVAGVVAATTGGATAHAYVADAGGLPAVRTSGLDVLATSGANAANTAMTGPERTMIVIAGNFGGKGAGSDFPIIAGSGTGLDLLFQAEPASTGFYPNTGIRRRYVPCGDAGMRSIAHSSSVSKAYSFDAINGTCLITWHYTGAPFVGGQLTIGGFTDAATHNMGHADLYAVLVWARALSAAEVKAVHRRYCELLGQARPGGSNARHVTFMGDSLTFGQNAGATADTYPGQLAAGLGLAWGTWDNLGNGGFTWTDIANRTLPMLGGVSAATGARSIVCCFEWANMHASTGGTVAAAARQVIDALHAQDGNRDVIFGTSTDWGGIPAAERQNRADYNAYWDNTANRAGIATYVPLHLDPTLGVPGAAPSGAANAYYQSDDLHFTPAGNAILDDGPYGFRPAVQARLAV